MAQTSAGLSSAKKLVQACLPFKPLDAPCTPLSSTHLITKKRRLIDGATASNRSAKSLKKEESRKPGKPLDCSQDDKEVSSSCEMLVGCLHEPQQSQSKNTSVWKVAYPLDHFIRSAQQLEVSTSCEESDVIDLTEVEDENTVVSTSADVSGNLVEDKICGLNTLKLSSRNSDDCLQSLKLDSNMNEDVKICSTNDEIVTHKKLAMGSEHGTTPPVGNDSFLPSQPCNFSVYESCSKLVTDDEERSVKNVIRQDTIVNNTADQLPVINEAVSDISAMEVVYDLVSEAMEESAVNIAEADALHVQVLCSCVSEAEVEPVIIRTTVGKSAGVECLTAVSNSAVQVTDCIGEHTPVHFTVDVKANDSLVQNTTSLVQQTTDGTHTSVGDAEQLLEKVGQYDTLLDVSKLHSPDKHVLESADDLQNSKEKERKCDNKRKMKLHTKTEKERICQEKQRLNDEKKKCRLIEKEKRENERLEAKINKERERQEKEKQRAEQKKQKEDERLQKIEQLKQEKKKKEDARLEEKRKKEEKRDRQEEKVVKEKELMQRFFVAVKETPAFKCQDIKGGPFMDFEVKENMRLAPLCRVDTLTAKDAARNLEKHFIEQDSVLLYLDELKSGAFRPRTSPPTWPCLEADVTVITAANSSACFMRAKLLQFHDNNRPAYYGTWRKHSRIINPRNPLQRDTSVFDYEVDSDDEWEEEEPGESLSHSEDDDDDETEAEQDEEGDGFFVPHGYLSEGEGCEDDEEELGISPEKRKARQLARASKWEADIAKKADVLHPIVIGINWWNPNAACDSLSKLQEFKVILFDKAPIATVNPADEASNGKLEGNDKRSKGPTYIPVPEAALQDLARLVHGNERSIKKLVREFCEFWFHKTATDQMSIEAGCRKCMISKGRLKRKIQEIAVYELRSQYPRRKLWYVNSDMLKALNLSDLPVPTEWHWITKLPSNGSSDDKKVYPETGDKPSLQLCSIKSYLTSQMDDKVDHTS